MGRVAQVDPVVHNMLFGEGVGIQYGTTTSWGMCRVLTLAGALLLILCCLARVWGALSTGPCRSVYRVTCRRRVGAGVDEEKDRVGRTGKWHKTKSSSSIGIGVD